jgi:hypothetical protein
MKLSPAQEKALRTLKAAQDGETVSVETFQNYVSGRTDRPVAWCRLNKRTGDALVRHGLAAHTTRRESKISGRGGYPAISYTEVTFYRITGLA